jgi:copper chaperone
MLRLSSLSKGSIMHEVKVSGLTCGGCVKSLTNALKAVDSKLEVDVDLNTQVVRIKGQISQEKIALTIEEAGFKVVSFN